MRAAVLETTGLDFAVQELQVPEPRTGEVRIRVAACGVCHTDLHVMKGEVVFPQPGVLGHEVSGVVDAVGPGVTSVEVGDRVVSAFIMPCGKCRHCVRGLEDICEQFFAYNRLKGQLYDGETRLFRPDGSPVAMYSMAGMAEYSVVPDTDVFRVPDGLPLEDVAILGCSVFTAVGAVRNVAGIRTGDTVAVIAVGGVGLNLVQVARAFGAAQVIAVDVADDKLELARQLGATHVVNSRETDPVAAVRELTGGRGVDVAFEALGAATTVESAIAMVDDGGAVVLVGIAPAGVTAGLNIAHVVRRKIRILGSYGARARTDMPLVLQLAAEGRIRIGDLISERVGLDEADAAFQRLARGEVLGRAVVVPGR
ncbi:MAG: alcohol dehydrogenase [Micrococcales bacterium 73-13]|nr:MAG: alcohol dehydrogenase [Micrococcales bacterium 73-13]